MYFLYTWQEIEAGVERTIREKTEGPVTPIVTRGDRSLYTMAARILFLC